MNTRGNENILSEKTDKEIIIKEKDINPEGRHPEDILSRLCNNDFCYDGIQCGCMEAFLQSLRYQNPEIQRQVCVMSASELGYRLEEYPTIDWRENQTLWWKGKPIKRDSRKYRRLIYEAHADMFRWSYRFRSVLMQTAEKKLTFDSGNHNPWECLLTDKEFCKILTRLRSNRRYTNWEHIPRLWPNSYGVEEDYI